MLSILEIDMGNLRGSIAGKSVWFFLTIAAGILWGEAASADVSFSDGTFNPGDWPAIVNFAGGGGTAGASHKTSGGNPGAFYQVTITANSGPSGTAAFFNNSAFTYTPSSQGAINSVTFSLDLANQGGTAGVAFANLALEQNGHIYAGPEYDVTSATGQTVGSTSLAATDFGQVTAGANGQFSLDLASNPNFSDAGSSILFGFTNIFNTPATFHATADEIMGVDNYNLVLHTSAAVPEPTITVLLLGGIGFLALGLFWQTKTSGLKIQNRS